MSMPYYVDSYSIIASYSGEYRIEVLLFYHQMDATVLPTNFKREHCDSLIGVIASVFQIYTVTLKTTIYV